MTGKCDVDGGSEIRSCLCGAAFLLLQGIADICSLLFLIAFDFGVIFQSSRWENEPPPQF